MQLTLEPYKFELCGATYAWVFFSEYCSATWFRLVESADADMDYTIFNCALTPCCPRVNVYM